MLPPLISGEFRYNGINLVKTLCERLIVLGTLLVIEYTQIDPEKNNLA